MKGWTGKGNKSLIKLQMVQSVDGEREICVYPESEITYVNMISVSKDSDQSATPELKTNQTSFQALNAKVS